MSVFIHHRAFAVLKKKKHVTSSKKKVREIKSERNLFGQLVLLAEHQYRQNSSFTWICIVDIGNDRRKPDEHG